MTLEIDALKLKKIFEDQDPFDSADPDDVRIRAEADKLKWAEQVRNKPKAPVFAIIFDQGDISFQKVGDYVFDRDEDVLFKDDGTEMTFDELRDELQTEFSSFMPVGIDVVLLGELQNMKRELDQLISDAEQGLRGDEE